jgi:hypothetical protein
LATSISQLGRGDQRKKEKKATGLAALRGLNPVIFLGISTCLEHGKGITGPVDFGSGNCSPLTIWSVTTGQLWQNFLAARGH